MSDKENALWILGVVAVGVAGFFSLRKNVNVKTTPINTNAYVDGVLQGAITSDGLSLHLSGQHTITFEAVSGYNTPLPRIEDFNILNTYNLLGTYTPNQTTGNLIANPDFDLGWNPFGLESWEISGTGEVTVVDSGTSEGNYARIYIPSVGIGIGFEKLSQIINLQTPGAHTFLLSAYVMGTVVLPEIYVTLLNAQGQIIGEEWYATLNPVFTPSFQLAEKTFTTTTDTAQVRVSVMVNNSTRLENAVVGVDKFSLIRI